MIAPAGSAASRSDAPPLELVARECGRRVELLAAESLPGCALEGQLIRPLVALAGAGGRADDRLWWAALAVQYAHEASLLHDDVIDEAVRRRGMPTVAAARGVAAALVEGDHLLTASYRLAARTGSIAYAELFARALERTVAGERLQGLWRGRVLAHDEYLQVVGGKSGELLGAAFAAAPLLRGDARADLFYRAGRELGTCYQMVDDLLDYCPAADTGKGGFGDYRGRIWTWPLAFLPGLGWEQGADRVVRAFAAPAPRGTPLEAALAFLREVADRTAEQVRLLVPEDTIVAALLSGWLERAERAVAATLEQARRAALPAALPQLPSVPAALPVEGELAAFFARNSRSFSFAARLFPPAERARVADVYAFCRVTDDLADDGALDAAERVLRLDAWLALCRRGYAGECTGVAVLDRVLGEAARSRVPFRLIEELVAGMHMDLRHRPYQSLADLRVYTYRVASVVGQWLTRLWGVHDQETLAGARDLGHAMQLTNILRDVGEDWRAGRLYLPRDLLARHGLDEPLIASLVDGAPVPPRWRALVEELMAVADAYYARAFAAIPGLPPAVRPAVAVAAEVYRGIHDAIRRNGYDNLNLRARPAVPRTLALAARALGRLRRVVRGARSRARSYPLPSTLAEGTWPST